MIGRSQVTSIRSHNSSMDLAGSGYILYSSCFKNDHIFSIGFKSGELVGQSSTSTPFSSYQIIDFFALCFGSLSCNSRVFLISRSYQSNVCLYSLFIISKNKSVFIVPLILDRKPTPLAVIHPQKVIPPPPNFG
ncbi:unnamed protein product [Cunninghamella blakesleeana]